MLGEGSSFDSFDWMEVVVVDVDDAITLRLYPDFLIALSERQGTEMTVFRFIIFQVQKFHINSRILVIVCKSDLLFVFGVDKTSCCDVLLS